MKLNKENVSINWCFSRIEHPTYSAPKDDAENTLNQMDKSIEQEKQRIEREKQQKELENTKFNSTVPEESESASFFGTHGLISEMKKFIRIK